MTSEHWGGIGDVPLGLSYFTPLFTLFTYCVTCGTASGGGIWANQPTPSFLVGCLNPCLQRTSVRVGSLRPGGGGAPQWSGSTGCQLQMHRLSLRNNRLKFIKTARQITDRFRRIYRRLYPNLIKETQRMSSTCNTRISTAYACPKISPVTGATPPPPRSMRVSECFFQSEF